ncbi:MAG TPA: non-homologous end-joining DNA ligase [Actinomycetota bacterium]|nr:non-homologous end-joining DNA ligase [Actinomycetota bacterium]
MNKKRLFEQISALPAVFAPMLPTLTDKPFDSPDHLFEVKWDGVRVLAFCDGSSTRLYSRTGRECTHQYPEFADLHRRLAVPNAVLDGEIVALDDHSRPSFELLQSRINLSRPSDIARGVRRVSLDLVLFDQVFDTGEWRGGLPLTERIDRLGASVSFGERVLRSEPIPTFGCALFEAARTKGLEGIVGKAVASRYLPGRRSRDWLKIKTVYDIDVVIGGFSAGINSRASSLGALQVGAYDTEGNLRYLGSVGTGFKDRDLVTMKDRLKAIEAETSPFRDKVPLRSVRWVKPELVAKVEYRELTKGLRLRAPSYKGLRDDKLPKECLLPE